MRRSVYGLSDNDQIEQIEQKEPTIFTNRTTSLLVEQNPEFLRGKTVFQAFGEHQYEVQGNINNCKHLQVGEYFIKVSSGAHHTFLLTNYGNIMSFGRNGDGQLGSCDVHTKFRNDITPIVPKFHNEGESVIDVQCGSNHTVILTNFSNCLGAGWNEFHQLGKVTGSKSLTFVYLDIGKPAVLVRCANNMTIVLTKRMEIYGTGRVSQPQAFQEFSLIQDFSELLWDEERITDVQCGSQHIIVTSSYNRIFAYGSNGFTQLGKKAPKDLDNFVEITKNLPFPRDDLKSVATGLLFSIFLTKGGGVYATGYNGYGQLGLGNKLDPEDFVRVEKFFKVKRETQSVLSKFETKKTEYQCYNSSRNSEVGSNVFYIDGNEIIKSVHCGSAHAIFVSNIGNVYTCGFNKFGQLNLPTDGDDYASVYSATQVVLSSHLIDIGVFANSSANVTIVADRQPINSYMSNNLKKRAREGELFDIILKHKR